LDATGLTSALLESAWITARIAAGFSGLLFVAAAIFAHFRLRPAPVRDREPGSLAGLLAMAGAVVAGVLLVGLTRGEAMRWLPPAAQGAVAAFATLASLAAGSFGAWAWWALEQNAAILAIARTGGSLVTMGPFAVVRHPIYLALGLLLIAGGLALGSLTGTLALFILYSPAATWRARLEERLLARAYPEQFAGYAARVPRLRPRL
jgi:protein-S-isoprenylcysteine O-methyltransferase Ste14